MDSDGVARVEEPRAGVGAGTWILGLAVLFTLASVALSAWLVSSPGEPDGGEPPPSVEVAAPAAAPAVRPVRLSQRVLPAPVAAPDDLPPQDGPLPPIDEAPPGVRSGLALFVPGTKPLKRGLVVPEGFELPPGYVRHFQATDDGQMLQAILMFHPDYEPLDEQGQPIALPEDRVVPPELAPPGLPMTLLELPESPESAP